MKDLDFPKLVKALRLAHGLTQEGLAREVGVTFATVNTWENGHRAPMPFLARRLVEMAQAAGLDVETFRPSDAQEDE
jgi:transcriptional regulator with XRE-family HTH domain